MSGKSIPVNYPAADIPGESRKVLERPSVGQKLGPFWKDLNLVDSRELESRITDPFWHKYSRYDLVPPLYPPELLSRVLSISETLSQTVDCMVTNIHKQGFEFKFTPPDDDPNAEPTDADMLEKQRLIEVLKYPNWRMDGMKLRERTGKDYYAGTSAYWEIVRDVSGEIREIHHAPAKSIRATGSTEDPVVHTEWQRNVFGQWEERERITRFRKYAQLTANGNPIFFREFGDPRQMDYRTGEYESEKKPVPLKYQATEILQFARYSQDSIYGEPIWASEMVKVSGAKKADDVNYLYFSQNAIPPMVITVENGILTKEAADRVMQMIRERRRGGHQSFYKVWLLEGVAMGEEDDEGKIPPVKIQVKPLTDFMQNDALFVNYCQYAARAVKRKYRLPDILLGDTKDFNRATAGKALQAANQQVFAPERSDFDSFVNRRIVAGMGIQSWRLSSLGPRSISDDEALKSLGSVVDAASVGQIQDLIQSITGRPGPQIDEETRNMLYGEFKMKFTPVQFQEDPDDAMNKLLSLSEHLEKMQAARSGLGAAE